MSYEPYADAKYYFENFEGEILNDDDSVDRRLRNASRHIDSLTFNRIAGQGFSNLAPFQQDIIKEVCCLQAEFECENEDELETILSGYSINGVSAQFGSSWNVYTSNGVAMKRDVYALLCQTGLCCRLAR